MSNSCMFHLLVFRAAIKWVWLDGGEEQMKMMVFSGPTLHLLSSSSPESDEIQGSAMSRGWNLHPHFFLLISQVQDGSFEDETSSGSVVFGTLRDYFFFPLQNLEKSSVGPLVLLKGGANLPKVPQIQQWWRSALSGFLFPSLIKGWWAAKSLFGYKEKKKMPFDLAGLKNQVLKPGKEEVKTTVGDSLGKLQRWGGLGREKVSECWVEVIILSSMLTIIFKATLSKSLLKSAAKNTDASQRMTVFLLLGRYIFDSCAWDPDDVITDFILGHRCTFHVWYIFYKTCFCKWKENLR